MEPISTVESLTDEQFSSQYFNRKPVMIKGGIKHTNCYKRWSLEYLKEKIGARSVKLAQHSTGVYNYAVNKIEFVDDSFDRMIERLNSTKGAKNNTSYLGMSPINEQFPQLLEDLETPKLIRSSDVLQTINLWVGGIGCDSGLHYDFNNNFYYQVSGSKELSLFSPDDSIYLYPSQQKTTNHVSEIQLYNIDHKRFPLFEKATWYKGIIEAGDVLYIPPYWWHDLLILETSISVNYWWERFDIPEAPTVKLIGLERVYKLIDAFTNKGFDINHVADDGELILLKSVKNGYTNIVEVLLLKGADANSKSLKIIPGASALYLAVEFGRLDEVRLLLEYGAKDIPVRNKTALALANEKGLTEITSLLMSHTTANVV